MTVTCRHCKSQHLNKAGFTHNRKQRYYCRDCRRFSRADPVGRAKVTTAISELQAGDLPTANHLILKIQALAQKIGRTPTTSDVAAHAKENNGIPLDIYYRVFGGFNEALRRAKLPLNYDQEFDKEKLISELKAVRRRVGRALLAKDVLAARKAQQVSSLYHFQRAFGSVPQAIAAADAGRRAFTKEEIRKYLAGLKSKLRRAPTGREIAEGFIPGETPSLKEVLRAFGSLRKIKNLI